jgi:ABC-2 type transport system ATP-binding protein
VALVELKGLAKDYGSVRALDGLDLTLDAGAWGLLGPNGAGKTTLLMILLGLQHASAGSARVLGLDPAAAPLAVRGRVGFVPEGDAFVPGYTGVGFVAFCGALSGMASADALGRAHEVLDYVGLGEARYRKVGEYSTGMKQRAKLAAALVHDPELLILDEPTNGLDPDGRRDMLALLQDLARNHGKAMIYASHVIPDVEEVCDAVLIIERGQTRYQGRMTELLALAERAYDVELVGDAERAAAALTRAGATVQRASAPGAMRVVLPEAGREDLLLRAVVESGARLRNMQRAGRRLDEGFAASLEAKA